MFASMPTSTLCRRRPPIMVPRSWMCNSTSSWLLLIAEWMWLEMMRRQVQGFMRRSTERLRRRDEDLVVMMLGCDHKVLHAMSAPCGFGLHPLGAMAKALHSFADAVRRMITSNTLWVPEAYLQETLEDFTSVWLLPPSQDRFALVAATLSAAEMQAGLMLVLAVPASPTSRTAPPI